MVGSLRKQKTLEAQSILNKPGAAGSTGQSQNALASTISLAENSVESVKGYDIAKRRWKDEKAIFEVRKTSSKPKPAIKIRNEDPKSPNAQKPRTPALGAIDLSVIESIPQERDNTFVSS